MKNDRPKTLMDGFASLGFRMDRAAFEAFLTHAHKSRLGPAETLEQLVTLERRAREATNLARRTRAACLGKFKTMDRFDWSHPRKLNRPLVDRLLTLDFIGHGQNVLLRGPSGAGKTMISKNLGILALQAGYSVRFCTLAGALGDLLKQESIPALERRMKRYLSPDLLILDELGYLPCDSRAADILYNIINRRHEEKSVVITTNLSFKQWSGVFPGAACVVALVDRFQQHCHKVDIDADSWRDTHPFDKEKG